MYIPCILRIPYAYPVYIFDSEMSFATDFTFTKAINSSCPGLFPAMQDVFIVPAFGADIVTSWDINEPRKFSSYIPTQVMFDFTMIFVTHLIYCTFFCPIN